MDDLKRFIPVVEKPVGETVRRHRRDQILIRFDEDERVKGCHVGIHDETAIVTAEGKSFIQIVHEQIVAPCTIDDVSALLPDKAELLAQLAEMTAARDALIWANGEMRAVMEQAQASAAQSEVTIAEQVAVIKSERASHAEEIANAKVANDLLTARKREVEAELDALINPPAEKET